MLEGLAAKCRDEALSVEQSQKDEKAQTHIYPQSPGPGPGAGT